MIYGYHYRRATSRINVQDTSVLLNGKAVSRVWKLGHRPDEHLWILFGVTHTPGKLNDWYGLILEIDYVEPASRVYWDRWSEESLRSEHIVKETQYAPYGHYLKEFLAPASFS